AYARDVGHAWRDDLPRLRDEFIRATDRDQALVALGHLQNSLRDAHCYLDPPRDAPRGTLRLGVDLWAGGTTAAPEVRIERMVDPALGPASGVAVGDAVIAVDRTPIAAWIAAHPFEAHALAPGHALAQTVASITTAQLPWTTVHPGDRRVLTVVHDGAPRDVALAFRASFGEGDVGPNLDRPPPMSQVDCVQGAPPDYGDYALAEVGVNVCVYLPMRAARPRIAIVRYLSFQYQAPDSARVLHMVRVDHDLLALALRGVDGVVLDLHENRGGINPFLFLGWFSSGPWDHPRRVIDINRTIDEAMRTHPFLGGEDARGYAVARAQHREAYVTRFLCSHEPCTAVTAPASERVTRAPVAVITGPECASSCDSFALTWAAFHLGPIVGKQPMHAYTVVRLPIEVVGPDHEDLGVLRIAASRSEIREGVPIEGEPVQLDWQAPDTFDTRTSWVRAALTEAVKRL
ncbi:MAG TPA: hypothetical protein VF469_28450, partial [Kofleriaceae bacterium]